MSSKGGFSKVVVLAVIALVITYTVADMVVFVKVGSEPETLTKWVLGFFIGELWALAFIKNRKVKSGATPQEKEEELNARITDDSAL